MTSHKSASTSTNTTSLWQNPWLQNTACMLSIVQTTASAFKQLGAIAQQKSIELFACTAIAHPCLLVAHLWSVRIHLHTLDQRSTGCSPEVHVESVTPHPRILMMTKGHWLAQVMDLHEQSLSVSVPQKFGVSGQYYGVHPWGVPCGIRDLQCNAPISSESKDAASPPDNVR